MILSINGKFRLLVANILTADQRFPSEEFMNSISASN
jgi:hypothetical protein